MQRRRSVVASGVEAALPKVGTDLAGTASETSDFEITPANAAGTSLWQKLNQALLALDQSGQLFLLFPFSVMLGIMVWTALPVDPGPPFALLAGVLFAGSLFALARASTGRWLLVLVIGLCGGFALIGGHAHVYGTSMLRNPVVSEVTFTITNKVQTGPERWRLTLTNLAEAPDASENRVSLPRVVQLYADQFPGSLGERWTARLRLYPVPPPTTHLGYDAQFHAYFDGVGAYASLLSGEQVRIETNPAPGLLGLTDAMRQFIATRLSEATSFDAAAILRAITVGDQSLVSDVLRTDMSTAGLAHLLAISGLHLTLVAGTVFSCAYLFLSLFHGLALRVPVKLPSALLALFVALAYLSVSGASVSAVRATIMLGLILMAALIGRRAITMRNVAIAASLILFLSPTSVFLPGFQLSFSAVVALIGVYELVGRGPRRREGPRSLAQTLALYVLGLLATSAIAGIATAPFSIVHFQNGAPFGIIGNMLALPVFAFLVLPAAMLGILLIPLGLDQLAFALAGWGTEQVIAVARWVAGLDTSWLPNVLLDQSALLVCFMTAIMFVAIPNRWRLAAPVAALPLILMFCRVEAPLLLVSDTSAAIAIVDGHGAHLASGRSGSFVTDSWTRTFDLEWASVDEGVGVPCDELGCLLNTQTGILVGTIAVPTTYDALNEDCLTATLIVTQLYAPQWCAQEVMVYDRQSLDRTGAAVVFATAHGPLVQPALSRPNRAWRPNASFR